MNPLDFKTFSLKGRGLIEASAGTGKTWTLTALYCRLIVERGVLPCHILVVTFTNAATAELHWRIRTSISQLIAAYKSGVSNDPLAEFFLSTMSAADALPRLHVALAGLDEARISTIHGFCQSTLEQYALEMGHWFEYQLSENLVDEVKVWSQDYFRLHCYDSSEGSQFRGAVLESPDKLVERVNHLILSGIPIKRLSNGDFNSSLEHVKSVWCLLRDHWWADRDVLVSYLLESKDLNRNKFRIKTITSTINDIDKVLTTFSFLFFKGANFSRFSESKIAGATKKGAIVFHHDFFVLCEKYACWLDDECVTWEEQVRYEAIQDGRKALEAKKNSLQVLSFDDLIKRMSDAVSKVPQLSDKIRLQCPYALIDEFQDTDSTQLDIFQSLYPDVTKHNLWLIGDPKQSIYRFRFADIHTYISARKAIAPHLRFTLGDNYRSSEGLIRGVNSLFSMNSDAFKFYPDIAFNSTCASGPRSNSKLSINGEEQAAWTCWDFNSDGDGQFLSKDALGKHEVEQIANEIQQLLNDGKCFIDNAAVTPNDIAIIVRSRKEMTQIAEVLKQREICCVIQDRSDVFSTQEALDIVEWLVAIEHRYNLDVVRRFMIGPLWGEALDGVNELDDDALEIQSVVSFLEQWAEQFCFIGCLGVLYKLLDLRGVSSRLKSQSNGDRKLTNWIHIAELITEDVAVKNGINEAIRWVERKIIESGSKEVSSQLQRLESDENLVTITTIHASKGLEFPIVFLPRLLIMGFGEAPRRTQWGVSYFDQSLGRSILTVHPDPDDEVVMSAAHEEMAESVRQAYVAVTRASIKNYVSWGPLKKWNKAILSHLMSDGHNVPSSCGDVLERWKKYADDCLEVRTSNCNGLTATPIKEKKLDLALVASPFVRSISDGFSVVSYSALAPTVNRKSESERLISNSEVIAESEAMVPQFELKSFPRGAHVGNALHAVLEWMAQYVVIPNDTAFHSILQDQLRIAGLDIGWIGPLEQWVRSICSHCLHEDGWSLANITLEDRVVEMEFYFPLNCQPDSVLKVLHCYGYDVEYLKATDLAGYLRGFIDLVVQVDGKFYVIDYKTNDLMLEPEQYQGDVLSSAIREHYYHLQYLLYCVALHRYLSRSKSGYEYDKHFGDVRYLFLRGMLPGLAPMTGVFVDRPSKACIEALSDIFAGGCYA